MNVVIDGVEYAPRSKIELMPKKFCEFLRDVRKDCNLSMDAAAAEIGCSKSYLWELEHGNGEPSLRMARNIANFYGLAIETLASYLTPNVKVRGCGDE